MTRLAPYVTRAGPDTTPQWPVVSWASPAGSLGGRYRGGLVPGEVGSLKIQQQERQRILFTHDEVIIRQIECSFCSLNISGD